MSRLSSLFAAVVALAVLLAAVPPPAWSCACGCGVFEVGSTPMLATRVGAMAWLEYDEMDQNRNWSGGHRAPDDDNMDKRLESSIATAGVQYMTGDSWGVIAELPYVHRYFKMSGADGTEGLFKHGAVGDIRLRGLYTGLSKDMTTGLSFGLKLPTGDYTAPGFDRDTEIGTGSTDLLLGGYHVAALPGRPDWRGFVNGSLALPVFTSGPYRPGAEAALALGGYYAGWKLGAVGLAPVAQVVGTHRWRDSGTLAKSRDTGSDRLVAAGGAELSWERWRFYADAGFPVYDYVNGNQLVAPRFYKASLAYAF